nr:ATP-binding protein [Brevundimonas basaltis]
MLRLQKSEAIGQFASGVAHDFNNLLTVVIGNLEQIRSDAQAAPDITRRAGMALEAAQRGARLSNQLLGFARDGHADAGPVDVIELLNDVSELVRQSVGGGVAVTVRADPHANLAHANRDQLELAILNLALNARDAMAGQGSLTVETSLQGRWVEIAVEDSGPGVPAEARGRLFDPFFTTKPEDQGTGLGLAQVQDMATRAGGDVRVEDAVGGGARFVIVLPVAGSGQTASAVTD